MLYCIKQIKLRNKSFLNLSTCFAFMHFSFNQENANMSLPSKNLTRLDTKGRKASFCCFKTLTYNLVSWDELRKVRSLFRTSSDRMSFFKSRSSEHLLSECLSSKSRLSKCLFVLISFFQTSLFQNYFSKENSLI